MKVIRRPPFIRPPLRAASARPHAALWAVMVWLTALALALSALWPSRVSAQSGGFTVSVTVLPSDAAATRLMDAVTLPEPFRILVDRRDVRGFLVERGGQEIARHLETTMADRGWRLTGESRPDAQTLEQLWSGRDGRLRIQLREPLGSLPATRVEVRIAP